MWVLGRRCRGAGVYRGECCGDGLGFGFAAEVVSCFVFIEGAGCVEVYYAGWLSRWCYCGEQV